MDEKTVEALTKLAKAAAKQQGWDGKEPLEIRISNQTEPNVCNIHCGICEGNTHHWMENFESDAEGKIINPDNPVWSCKHCQHSVPYAEPEKHPSGCDCPDCFPSEDWLCSCGNYIENGLHCDNCNEEPPWGCPCSFCDEYDEDWTDGTEDYGDLP